MKDPLFAALNDVHDETSFLVFARALLIDRQAVERMPLSLDGFRHQWANDSIAAFIEGAVAWSEDSDFGAGPGPKASNPWALFAAFLWAGRGYE